MIDRGTLTSEHAGLAEAAERLREAVAAATPDLALVVRCRWQLGYRLAVHLAREDMHVYPELKAHADPVIASAARAFENEMGGLDQRFRDYVGLWTAEAMAERWDEFALVTRVLLDALARRIDREENHLYPLLDATGEDDRRRASAG